MENTHLYRKNEIVHNLTTFTPQIAPVAILYVISHSFLKIYFKKCPFLTYDWNSSCISEHFRFTTCFKVSLMILSLEVMRSYRICHFVCEPIFRAFSSAGVQMMMDVGTSISASARFLWVHWFLQWGDVSSGPALTPRADTGFWFLMGAVFYLESVASIPERPGTSWFPAFCPTSSFLLCLGLGFNFCLLKCECRPAHAGLHFWYQEISFVAEAQIPTEKIERFVCYPAFLYVWSRRVNLPYYLYDLDYPLFFLCIDIYFKESWEYTTHTDNLLF